jgi:hypothetical protein
LEPQAVGSAKATGAGSLEAVGPVAVEAAEEEVAAAEAAEAGRHTCRS